MIHALYRKFIAALSWLAGGFYVCVIGSAFSPLPTSAQSGKLMLYSYFTVIYIGNGVDHMNINLVNLRLTGLSVGDEIGVFDGLNCVGAQVILDQDMQDNGLSIPASANDTVETSPNGFIDGHKITLKVYHDGVVYPLDFQTVNNSFDVFRRRESVFVLVDFPVSSRQILTSENFKIYPNPFNVNVNIEIDLPLGQTFHCEIIDVNGRQIRSLCNGKVLERIQLIWDGRDSNNQPVPSGIYFCRFNGNSSEIIVKQNSF
ncbi:MAG: T9SS type A sorting domain-containing protein [Prolixibacteraceae bacterium]